LSLPMVVSATRQMLLFMPLAVVLPVVVGFSHSTLERSLTTEQFEQMAVFHPPRMAPVAMAVLVS